MREYISQEIQTRRPDSTPKRGYIPSEVQVKRPVPRPVEPKIEYRPDPRPIYRTRRRNFSKLIILILILFLALASGASFYLYKKLNTDPKAETAKEIEYIIKKVGEHIVLPKETPTIATVSDPEKLRDQPFFDNAKVGDKVLVFSTSGKAILYSPSLDKIIEVAPINATHAGGTQ